MASRVIQPPAGPSKPLPAYTLIQDNITRTLAGPGDILSGARTVPAGRYLAVADWWVNSANLAATGGVVMMVDGLDVTSPARDVRDRGFYVSMGFWISDGNAHTWSLRYIWESGSAVFGLANDLRWGRTIKLIGPLG